MARSRTADPSELLLAARAGDRLALARLLSLVERNGDEAREVARLVHGPDPVVATVGITGAPGAGKSTLTNALVGVARAEGARVAVLAIDPSSPFAGGAILGDQVRMGDHATDDGVFIRSMATRGHLGGLAVATPGSVRVLAAVGFDWVLIETVGVGQVEVEVAGATDARVVVLNPGWGDAVQANKAGLLEIADVFAINKADRPGVAEARRDLEQMLELGGARDWRPPVVSCVATTSAGVEELWAAVAAHRAAIEASGELERRRRARVEEELREVLAARLAAEAEALASDDRYRAVRDEVVGGGIDPWTAVDRLLSGWR